MILKTSTKKVPDEKVRENILREKYQLKRHGTQQVANKAQMDVLKEKAKGGIGIANHTPRKKCVGGIKFFQQQNKVRKYGGFIFVDYFLINL